MPDDLKPRHILSVADLTPTEIDALTHPDRLLADSPGPGRELRGPAALVFAQESLRTVTSFIVALDRIGLTPIYHRWGGDGMKQRADLYDELHQLCLMGARVIVCRTAEPLDRDRVSTIPAVVVNAGDGRNEHPTQALIDLTAMRSVGINGKRVTVLGNALDQRSVHSLVRILGLYDVDVTIVCPVGYGPEDRDETAGRVTVVETENRDTRDEILAMSDFIYQVPPVCYHCENTRLAFEIFELRREDLAILKPTARILHPFPRLGELDPAIDSTKFNLYFTQTRIGGDVRYRLLRMLLEP